MDSMHRYVTGLFTKEHGKDGMKTSDAGDLVAAYSKSLETVIGLDKSLQKSIQRSSGLRKCSPSLHQLRQAKRHEVERHGSRELRKKQE